MNDLSSGHDLSVAGCYLTLQALLEPFLESSLCPKNTMNFYQLDGYLHALACAPVKLSAAEWQPLIFNDETPAFTDGAQAKQVQRAIVGLYDFHCMQVGNARCDLPCQSVYASEQQDRANIEQWSRGFLQGYIVCESNWRLLLDGLEFNHVDLKIDAETILNDFDAILSIVSVVADAKYAVEQGTKAEELSTIFVQLPESLIRLGQIGQLFKCS